MFLCVLLCFFHLQVVLSRYDVEDLENRAFHLHHLQNVSHSLIYYYTLNHGNADLPEYSVVGALDGCEIQYYDRTMEMTVPRQKWMAAAFDKSYWAKDTMTEHSIHGIIKGQAIEWLQQHNESTGYHYLQGQFGCQLNDHSPNIGILKLAYDGKYILSFDKDKLEWIVHDPVFQPFKKKWDKNERMNKYFKNLLEKDCVRLCKDYYAVGKTYLTRKVVPEVGLDAQKRNYWFLQCSVFGFYPTAIKVSWFQNEKHVSETKSTGVLPNEDGTYQLRSVLDIDPFDGKKYYCHVNHSSMPNGKTVIWDSGKKDRHIGLIGVCVLLLLSAILAGIYCWTKKRSDYENIPAHRNVNC
ncbi:major histocompatibility complex class I-related gene protein-like isoform X2 [Mobula birostris]|uniref:major histocompatibility complex class I-related gene protein-like isoform X2 n=1 Tax=Mobula birostris TaxID=1983395 RepID=UPI003B28C222